MGTYLPDWSAQRFNQVSSFSYPIEQRGRADIGSFVVGTVAIVPRIRAEPQLDKVHDRVNRSFGWHRRIDIRVA